MATDNAIGFNNDAAGQRSAAEVRAYFQEKLRNVEHELAMLLTDGNGVAKAKLLLEKANAFLGLSQQAQVWAPAREALDIFVANDLWTEAVTACDLLYQAEQPDSVKALAHGAWLAIAFPIDPELSVSMLEHLVDEMPPNADGAAVAAATAHYIVGLRADDEKFDSLNFASTALIAHVAKRHSNVESQEILDFWMERLGLNDPALFLPRMGQVLDAIVAKDAWWFDRDQLRAKLPH